jgi:hypothetical protein
LRKPLARISGSGGDLLHAITPIPDRNSSVSVSFAIYCPSLDFPIDT